MSPTLCAVSVVQIADITLSERAARFEGADHGAQVSFFITTHERGAGPDLHRHPYEETFIVQGGEALFTIEDETIAAMAGQIVVVPAQTRRTASRAQATSRCAR